MKIQLFYARLPLIVKWVIFLPVSALGAICWGFILRIATPQAYQNVVNDVFLPTLIQIVFIYLVYYTIPKWKIQAAWVIFVLRSLLLIPFIISILIALFIPESEMPYTMSDWKALIGEIIVFFSTLTLIKSLKSDLLESSDSEFGNEEIEVAVTTGQQNVIEEALEFLKSFDEDEKT